MMREHSSFLPREDDAEKGPCSTSGWQRKSNRCMKSREMCLCLKGEVADLPFPQRGK